MGDRISEKSSLEMAWEAFKEDWIYSVNLYFAPVRAVIGEFERAITCGWDNQGPHLQPPGGESGADDDRATRGFSAGF